MKDWADLPPELIHLISNKLPDVRDFIRFHAVCKSWHSSAPLSDPPPQLPWLVECIVAHIPETRLQQGLRFYSLVTGETGTVRVKESHRDISYQEQYGGYLILSVFAGQLWMCNLFINDHITFLLDHCPLLSLWPIWTGSETILMSRKIIFVVKEPDLFNEMGLWGLWAVYHPDNTQWNVMKGYVYNSCYWDGMLFTTSRSYVTKVFDGTSQKLLYEIPSPEEGTDDFRNKGRPDSYLVVISGVVMRICRFSAWSENVEDSIFHFYELHFDGRDRKPSWVKVSDINNHMLFLDEKNGFSMKPVSGFKGNCIYFLTSWCSKPCRYDIATGTFQKVPCPFEACNWFLPSLH